MPELTNPAGLLWLALLPLLLVPYLLTQRPRRRIVPALFLYEGIERAERLRIGGRLRLRPLVLLQLLLLLLAIAAIARPLVRSSELRAALVIDDSASMQTIEASGYSRFVGAVAAGKDATLRDPAAIWDLFLISPSPRELALGVGPSEARGRLQGLTAGACPHPDDAELRSFLEGLAKRGYASIHVVTDRPGGAPPFDVVTVGAPKPNLAITDATRVPSAIAGKPALFNVIVENFSARKMDVPITVRADDESAAISSGTLSIAARGSASFTTEAPPTVKLTARIESGDPLPLDDEVTVAPERSGERRVLLVSSSAGGLDSLEKLLGFRLEVVAPSAYRPEMARGRDLVIFHRSAPAEAPPTAALYLLPPDAPFLPASSGSSNSPSIGFSVPTHPVARYLNSAALRPRQVLTLRELAGWEPLAVAGGGPVLLTRSGRARSVVSGIDLLPYLGDRNRPASILTLNLLSWLLAAPGDQANGADGGGRGCALLGRTESDLEHPPPLPIVAEADRLASAVEKTRPLWPWLTLGAIVLLLVEAWFHRSERGLAWALRAVALALLVAAWLDPMRVVAGAPPRPLVLVDVSGSLLGATRDRGLDATGVARDAPVVAFAGRSIATKLSEASTATQSAEPGETDIEAALFALADSAPEGAGAFLVSDGWETRGSAEHALDALAARRVRIYPIAAEQPLAPDVAVQLSLPAESPAGSVLRAELLLRSDNPGAVAGQVIIRQGSKVLVREDVRLPPGRSLVARPLLITGNGLVALSGEFQPSDPATDADRTNDVAKAWVAVGSGRRVLLVGHESRDNRYLEHALAERGIRVRSVARANGEAVPDVSGFAAVLLNDVPLSDLPSGYAGELREAVRGGAGLAMIGGPRSFGLGGYRGTAIEEALPVRMKERARDEPQNAVALVIDKSGSMREERRIVYAREAARQLVEHLKPHDLITVIGFDRDAFVVIPLAEVGEVRADFDSQIARLKPEGATRMYPALEEARRALLGERAKRRHIIVLSDGLSEDAERASGRRQYYDLALALSEQGVTLSTVALGHEADADFLERLASFGRGAFHETADASSLPEIVLGEFDESGGREKTLAERDFRPVPSRDSPVVGEIVRSDPTWPPVRGLVETELKREARLDVGVAESAVPLIASWEYGRGRAVAVTTDADGRWSDRWLRWKEWSRLWGEIVRWLAREEEGKGPEPRFALAYRDGALEIDYSRFDADAAGSATAKVSTPDARTQEVPLVRIAAGHYRGRFVTRVPGAYRIEIRSARGLATDSALGFTIPASASGERPRREPAWSLLETIAARTAGEVNPPPGRVAAAPAPWNQRPLAPHLLAAAIAIFLAEIVWRRVRSA